MLDIASAFAVKNPRILLVASNGGHLEQLYRLREGSTVNQGSEWVTFDTPQARGLSLQSHVHFVPEVAQRDWKGVMQGVPQLRQILQAGQFDGVVSTGAAIAVSAFLASKRESVPSLYIESVSRVKGPSLTGRIVQTMRLTDKLWAQHPGWAKRRWEYSGSILDNFESYHVAPPEDPPKLFVTLGTLKKYPFSRPVSRLVEIGAPNRVSVWQLGVTLPPESLEGEVSDFFSPTRFDEAALSADAVISHAGVGSVLRLLELGIYPLLVVRRRSHGEHVDDHQAQIAALLAERDLALVREADEVTLDDVREAASRKVRSLSQPGQG